MKKPPQAQKAVATQPVRSKFPFIGASWVLIGVSGVAIALCVAAGATDILRGHVRVEERSSTGQAKPSSPAMQKATSGKANDLVTEYGPAARSPAVAAAIKRAESTPGAKAAADRQEALAHGVWRSGADPMQAIMYGYVPPGMPAQQAAMLYRSVPHLPAMQQPMPPEITDPDPVRDMLRAQGLEQFNNPAANQRMVEGYMRERFGPVYVPPLQRGHNHPPDQIITSRVATVSTKDRQGSIREMTDASGNIVAEYAYDPYGRQTRIAGAGPDADFGYQGYYVHQRSGLNLTATRAYSPTLGRFLNRDPIGEDPPVEMNLYAYVANNPISRFDPEGTTYSDLGGFGSINGPLGSAPPNPIGFKCLLQCASKFPVLGPLLWAGGLPLIPVAGKTGGAIIGTSPFSVGLRGLVGGFGFGGPYWAPTGQFPFNQFTPFLGGAIGRWLPIIGAALTAKEYADFLCCLQNCVNGNSSNNCNKDCGKK